MYLDEIPLPNELSIRSVLPASMQPTHDEIAGCIRELARRGVGDHDISALTDLSVLDVRRVLAERIA